MLISEINFEGANSYNFGNSDLRHYVVYSNDDFFEKELFEKEIYNKEEGNKSIPTSVTTQTEKVTSNQDSKNANYESREDEHTKYSCISVDNLFEMEGEEIFRITGSHCSIQEKSKAEQLLEDTKLESVLQESQPMQTKLEGIIDKIDIESSPLIEPVETPKNQSESIKPSKIKELLERKVDIVVESEEDYKNAETETAESTPSQPNEIETVPPKRRFDSYFSSSNHIEIPNHLSASELLKNDKPNQHRFSVCTENVSKMKSDSQYINYFGNGSLIHKKFLTNGEYLPSVGVGILLVNKEKILIGRRIDSGMYGLPGGWIEYSENWDECASRELKEETGINLKPENFKHIYTLNLINKEKNFHSISCVMYGIMEESEMSALENKEPNKCYGWVWATLSDIRTMATSLFYPLREFLNRNIKIQKASDFNKMIKEKIDLDSIFNDHTLFL